MGSIRLILMSGHKKKKKQTNPDRGCENTLGGNAGKRSRRQRATQLPVQGNRKQNQTSCSACGLGTGRIHGEI